MVLKYWKYNAYLCKNDIAQGTIKLFLKKEILAFTLPTGVIHNPGCNEFDDSEKNPLTIYWKSLQHLVGIHSSNFIRR